MVLTELQARELSCNQAIQTMDACRASACMAWRWYTLKGGAADQRGERRGYCGLAGLPTVAE